MKQNMWKGQRFLTRRKSHRHTDRPEKPAERVLGDADSSAKAAAEAKRARRRTRNLMQQGPGILTGFPYPHHTGDPDSSPPMFKKPRR